MAETARAAGLECKDSGSSDYFSASCIRASRKEVDYYRNTLTAVDGRPVQGGWLTDKSGLSWQIVPVAFFELLRNPDAAKSARVIQAIMQIARLDIAKLRAAAQ